MVYVINGKSVVKTNKDIIRYINSHKDKKYIILVDNTVQAKTYQKKIEIDFVRIEGVSYRRFFRHTQIFKCYSKQQKYFDVI